MLILEKDTILNIFQGLIFCRNFLSNDFVFRRKEIMISDRLYLVSQSKFDRIRPKYSQLSQITDRQLKACNFWLKIFLIVGCEGCQGAGTSTGPFSTRNLSQPSDLQFLIFQIFHLSVLIKSLFDLAT